MLQSSFLVEWIKDSHLQTSFNETTIKGLLGSRAPEEADEHLEVLSLQTRPHVYLLNMAEN